jgi:hypothetical protein
VNSGKELCRQRQISTTNSHDSRVTLPIVLPDWKHGLATGCCSSADSEGDCAAAWPRSSSEEVG